jgi:hypothetical protein
LDIRISSLTDYLIIILKGKFYFHTVNYLDIIYDVSEVVALGGLVISVLATGPDQRFAGSNPAEDDGF